jgi:putative membrane protein insertion efficiency factor
MMWTSVLIAIVRGYQRYVSSILPPSCRFYPSCSEYAVQALTHYGLFRGALKAAWRLLRCHPLSRGGVDLPTTARGDSLQ